MIEAPAQVAVDNTQMDPAPAEPGWWLLKGLVKCDASGVGTNCQGYQVVWAISL
jgi:hypothetical protein